MEKRKALLTIALAAVMLVGGCGKAAEMREKYIMLHEKAEQSCWEARA